MPERLRVDSNFPEDEIDEAWSEAWASLFAFNAMRAPYVPRHVSIQASMENYGEYESVVVEGSTRLEHSEAIEAAEQEFIRHSEIAGRSMGVPASPFES